MFLVPPRKPLLFLWCSIGVSKRLCCIWWSCTSCSVALFAALLIPKAATYEWSTFDLIPKARCCSSSRSKIRWPYTQEHQQNFPKTKTTYKRQHIYIRTKTNGKETTDEDGDKSIRWYTLTCRLNLDITNSFRCGSFSIFPACWRQRFHVVQQ